MYFQIRGEKSWNWWLRSGSQQGDLRRKELEGGALNWRRKKRRKSRSMGHPPMWIFLLSLSLSHQRVAAQAEGNCCSDSLLFFLFPVFFFFFFYSHVYSFPQASAVLTLTQNHMSGFQAQCAELWIRWLGYAGQRKGRCSVSTVWAGSPSLKLLTWADTEASPVSLRVLPSRGIQTSVITYSTALRRPVQFVAQIQNLNLRCYW